MSDIKLAVETLKTKTTTYAPFFEYYVGDQPLRYAAERLRDVFQSKLTRFTQNWCAVVVNATLDRLTIDQWQTGENDAIAERLLQLWRVTGLDADAEAVHRAVMLTGEAFVIVGQDETGAAEAYYHDPRICHIWYEAENPRRKRMAAKWWRDEERRWRINLYYADRVEQWRGSDSDYQQAAAYALEATLPNELGVVPVFHFYRDRHLLISELDNVVPLQDAINKLLADMMIAAEFSAFRQRWIVTNADTSKLRNAPNEIWELPAALAGEQPTNVGEFGATDLSNYLDAVDRLATSIGVITQTPRHYFFQQGGDPSGEALIAMEAPLVRKIEHYQARLSATWREVGALLLAMDGIAIDPLDISVIWQPVATIQPRTQAEIRQLSVAAGMPLTTLLRDEGWTEADLQQLAADKADEQQAQQTQLATALMRAQTQFDQGDNNNG